MTQQLLTREKPSLRLTKILADVDHITSATEIVDRLVNIVGPKLTGMVGGARDTRQVRRWLNGTQPERLEALRAALRAAAIIADFDTPKVARAWFLGAQPHLKYQSPVLELRENTPESYVNVVRAAIEFARA